MIFVNATAIGNFINSNRNLKDLREKNFIKFLKELQNYKRGKK